MPPLGTIGGRFAFGLSTNVASPGREPSALRRNAHDFGRAASKTGGPNGSVIAVTLLNRTAIPRSDVRRESGPLRRQSRVRRAGIRIVAHRHLDRTVHDPRQARKYTGLRGADNPRRLPARGKRRAAADNDTAFCRHRKNLVLLAARTDFAREPSTMISSLRKTARTAQSSWTPSTTRARRRRNASKSKNLDCHRATELENTRRLPIA